MERNVDIINGNELTINHIKKFVNIYSQIFNNEFDTMLNVKAPVVFESFFEEKIDNLTFVIGEDWFLIYSKVYEYIKFHLWGAIDNKDTKIVQSIEMYNTFMNILIKNMELCFEAEMVHTSSYNFYLSMLEKGYIEEIGHKINGYNLNKIESAKLRLKSNSEKTDVLIDKGLIVNKNDLERITHEVMFMMSDEFINKYRDDIKKCR